MQATRISACAWLMSAALAGCAGSGEVEYSGGVAVTSPELVTVSPGVQVVADADEPLFFVDGNYYLYRDGYWLRSDSYRGNFFRIERAPAKLTVINQPQAYVHFRRNQGRAYARESQQPTRTRTPQPQPPREPNARPVEPYPMPKSTAPTDIDVDKGMKHDMDRDLDRDRGDIDKDAHPGDMNNKDTDKDRDHDKDVDRNVMDTDRDRNEKNAKDKDKDKDKDNDKDKKKKDDAY
jgi:hypothetical protein